MSLYSQNYKLIDWSKPIEMPSRPQHELKRSSLPRPMVISDTMDPVQSQLDGKYYTSKSRLRETYRDAGMIEVGNDAQRFKKPERQTPDRKAIRASLERAKARLS